MEEEEEEVGDQAAAEMMVSTISKPGWTVYGDRTDAEG